MGTRSLTFCYEEKKKEPFFCMYAQYDGYPNGIGAELAYFLNSRRLVNGIGADEEVFNGMPCLAAQLISFFKDGAGGYYIYPAKLEQECHQEYEYHIFTDKVKIIEKYDNKTIFEGSWSDFLIFCNRDE